jgi:hypothetical protein
LKLELACVFYIPKPRPATRANRMPMHAQGHLADLCMQILWGNLLALMFIWKSNFREMYNPQFPW